jgi:predicted ATPase
MQVFLFEALDFFEQDYARIEGVEEARALEKLLEKSYQQLNVPLLKVPAMPVEKRVEFILDYL